MEIKRTTAGISLRLAEHMLRGWEVVEPPRIMLILPSPPIQALPSVRSPTGLSAVDSPNGTARAKHNYPHIAATLLDRIEVL